MNSRSICQRVASTHIARSPGVQRPNPEPLVGGCKGTVPNAGSRRNHGSAKGGRAAAEAIDTGRLPSSDDQQTPAWRGAHPASSSARQSADRE